MQFFQILSGHQRAMKIASVATLELATRQQKKSLKKIGSSRVGTFVIFIVADADATKFEKLHHQCEQKIARVAA